MCNSFLGFMRIPGLVVKEQEPLANHTVFRIGGPARFYAEVASPDQWIAALAFAEERGMPWTALGAGSNVLVADAGFPGLAIHPIGGSGRDEESLVEGGGSVFMARLPARK